MNEEKICQYCGETIENDYNVCPHCGKKVIEELKPNETKCIACGGIIENDYNICPHCGEEINNNTSKKNGTICLILYILFGGVFAHRLYVGRLLSTHIVMLIFYIIIMFFMDRPLYKSIYLAIVFILRDFIDLLNGEFTDSKGKYIKIDETENKKNCKSCGKFIENGCIICPYCKAKNENIFSEKNGIIYLILLVFLGIPFLIHRFYIGKIKSSIIVLFRNLFIAIVSYLIFILHDRTYILPIIVSIVCYIFIPQIVVCIKDLSKLFKGDATDSKGKYIKLWKINKKELKKNNEELGKLKKSEFQICSHCGKSFKSGFKICPHCKNSQEISPKSGIVCLLLLIFFGHFGAHRFYSGDTDYSFMMIMLTMLILSSLSNRANWTLIELIFTPIFLIITLIFIITDLISIVTGQFRDSEGRCIKIK